jgi:hypothetical protein
MSAYPGGFRAATPAQRLTTSFGPSGIFVTSGSTWIRLDLRGVDYGNVQTAVRRVAPVLSANQVVYRRDALSEWYANGPLGLEQGFTIPRAPAHRSSDVLMLALTLSSNARTSLAKGAKGIVFSRGGQPVVRYAGLSAIDSQGHQLRSWLQLDGVGVQLHVNARGAAYPIRIDPLVEQGGTLTGSGQIINGGFGYSLALSANGDTALVGSGQGAAWVFTRSGATWTEQAKLAVVGFGNSVALSADGNTALIGGQPSATEGRGAAWVFTRTGTTWAEQAQLSGGGAIGLVSSVALSSDGDTALVGDGADSGGHGAAWVFTRVGSTWAQQGEKLTAKANETIEPYCPGNNNRGNGDPECTEFGRTVALSGDGATALIGGPGDNADVGAAWVFTRTGSTWAQQGQKLTGGEQMPNPWPYGGGYATALALSSDGDTALIGAWGDNDTSPGFALGAAWVFTRTGSTWSQQGGKLTLGSKELAGCDQGEPPGTEHCGAFGLSVALSGDGNTALISVPYEGDYTFTNEEPKENIGGAWVFTRSGSSWAPTEEVTPSGRYEGFGQAAALSRNGSTALFLEYVGPDSTAVRPFFTPVPVAQPFDIAQPTISGSPEVERSLSCSPGTWGEDPETYAFTWLRDGTAVTAPSLASDYAVVPADEGQHLACRVTATNSAGSITATSESVLVGAPIPPPPGGPPVNTSPPVVTAIYPARGNDPTYLCPSSWSGTSPILVTVTWLRDGAVVSSLPDYQPYIASASDAGHQLSCTATATNSEGSTSATSASGEVPGYWQPAVRLLPMPINEVREPCYRFLGSSTCDAPTIYFAGEIIPGSKPVTQYEFRYAPLTYTSPLCDSYGQNCLPSQKEVGGSNPPTGPIQACVGQCPPPYGTVSRLPAFQRWVYYLEAKDGITDTKSTPETYLSGGLINPQQWEPAKELSLTLECPSSCPGIETQANFGVHAPFRGTETATIKVTNFNRANGYFEGTVQFSAWAGGSPKVHGQLAEGLANLNFETSLGPITSAFRNFNLGGAITYAGVNFDTTNGYSSKFEGTTGNGGKWVVCSGSAAGSNCPGRPNAETKAVAGNLSSGADIIGLGFATIPGLDLIDIGVGVVGVVTDLIAHDPPDPAYARIAVPPKLRPVVIRPGPRLSRRAAATGTRVLNGLREVAGYGEALLNAVQRMQGAIRARQRAWVARQTGAAIKYSLDMAKQCRSLAQALNSTRTVLSHSAIGRLRLSAKQVARGIQSVRRHGLPSRVMTELRTMGFTPEMIRSARQLVADSPHHAVAPFAGLLAPAFSEHLVQLANQLEEYAKTLATSPHS